MKTQIFDTKGKQVKEIELPTEVFEVNWNGDLVHQVVTSLMSTARPNVAHAKDRSEVAGGGRKPWRQKGTGRARHGSIRSPLWRGGGVTFGPRNDKNYDRKVNKRIKAKALAMILSKKMKDGEVLFVDSIKIDEPKTKQAKEIMNSLGQIKDYENLAKRRKNTAIISLAKKNICARTYFWPAFTTSKRGL